MTGSQAWKVPIALWAILVFSVDADPGRWWRGTRTRTTQTRTTQTATTTSHTSTSVTTTTTPTQVWTPQDPTLLQPSEAPLQTFYIYRVQNAKDNYLWENVNAANLAGAMWYLHNEVVIAARGRKFGASKIVRYKLTMRATTPLWKQGMNFGIRYAFDAGRCAGPGTCQDQYDNYGYFVGCNYVGNYPTGQWRWENRYPNAIWYSLPGPCSSMEYSQRTPLCDRLQPGGHCNGTNVTGQGNCTYIVEPAGEITIDEMEHFGNYYGFLRRGGREYDPKTDRGNHTGFWNGKRNAWMCKRRVDIARRHFARKYGKDDLPSPACDFNISSFYPEYPRGKWPTNNHKAKWLNWWA